MANNGRTRHSAEQMERLRRHLRPINETTSNRAASASANPQPSASAASQPATMAASPTLPRRPEAATASSHPFQPAPDTVLASIEATSSTPSTPFQTLSARGRPQRENLRRGEPRADRHPPWAPTHNREDASQGDSYDRDLAFALQHDWADGDDSDTFGDEDSQRPASAYRHRPTRTPFPDYDIDVDLLHDSPGMQFHAPPRVRIRARDHVPAPSQVLRAGTEPNVRKRPLDNYEGASEMDITRSLHYKGATAVMLYNSASLNPEANDIWPQCRSAAKLPATYFILDQNKIPVPDPNNPPAPGPNKTHAPGLKSKSRSSRRNGKKAATAEPAEKPRDLLPDAPAGRPEWNLPVELVELIAEHLNRDDIKALRLVSRELNRRVSQVIFQTVVVPFNTEIYGMLGQEPTPDLKGKKRARIDKPIYSWKNANGDEVYNGHGLDVFRGFGGHIRKFGMSFEVNEESLSTPPVKSLTEKKTSFWGNYDWPYEEYRRFDAVAGLETAADETPRMKTAFSELTKVKELALSIDSGLGWLNGPDRSIRARVLHRPSRVFGTTKTIPDRRAQAQQELWNHIEACHQKAGSQAKLATLYRIDASPSPLDFKEANKLADAQPQMPYLDPQLLHAAIPYDAADMPIPSNFDDPCVLDQFVSASSPSGTGILFSSTKLPSEGAQLVNPVIPASLTKAQKEWLLETEWAQRAFMSSYLLSVIDNPITFQRVHTFNLSGLSDRYLPMLNRSDFWEALPDLRHVTIMLIPGWRSVQKDEAGFVDTPIVNPTQGMGAFFDLLRDHIACRQNIRHLKVGFVTGGEHAEGLYARNKLLFPAPVVDLRIRSQSPSFHPVGLLSTEVARLKECVLQFPHVEHLVLNNCWIPPTALLQFVKLHDQHKLQSLVLDSVSLTAMLRPPNNPHNVAHQAAALQGIMAPHGIGALFGAVGAVGAHGPQVMPHQPQFLQTYFHVLQMQLQQLQVNAAGHQQNNIATLQNQLQQQIGQIQHNPGQQHHHQAQGQGQAQAPAQPQAQPHQHPHTFAQHFANIAQLATQIHQLQTQIATGQAHPLAIAAPANGQASGNSQSVLKAQPRVGSWIDIIDQISPGTNLSDFDSDHSKAESDRVTSLRTIEFISCGYAKLTETAFDQSEVDPRNLGAILRNPMFNKRAVVLSPAMLINKWVYLGEIVQEIDPSELAVLDAGWNLRTGWEDAEAAQAVEFDGLLAGGS
ncbi:hypothetical protein G6011_10211 [Alternaria panax]|uniref:F-box domain-containing protein n=1 Tax=Alternaria panax TaxID=48097 RepID=A0AAD4IBJ8_9PLEO|nr:hypothetical protein G6011_10211 [Alternaria panax]